MLGWRPKAGVGGRRWQREEGEGEEKQAEGGVTRARVAEEAGEGKHELGLFLV